MVAHSNLQVSVTIADLIPVFYTLLISQSGLFYRTDSMPVTEVFHIVERCWAGLKFQLMELSVIILL